jgi:hypothetical protein
MIDCTQMELTVDLKAHLLVLAKRHTPPIPLLVTEIQLAALTTEEVVIETVAHHYLDVVPITTSAASIPPVKPGSVPVAPPQPFHEAKLARAVMLQNEIRSYVDVYLPITEREGLAALLQKVTMMRMAALPVNEMAAASLMEALTWVENAMIMGSDVAAACQLCTTKPELLALSVDLESLGEPPIINAGQIAKALKTP